MLNISNEISARMKSSKIDCVVTSRIKSAYSVYRKMLEKDRSFEEITDIFGFRLVVPDVTACYQTLGVVHNLYKPDVSGFKDYIAIPKANGYQSLHTVLFGPYQDKIEVPDTLPCHGQNRRTRHCCALVI